jgi:hypothetical protein
LTAQILRYDCCMKHTDIRQAGRVIAWTDSLFETLPYPETGAQPMIPIGEAIEVPWISDEMFAPTVPAALGE